MNTHDEIAWAFGRIQNDLLQKTILCLQGKGEIKVWNNIKWKVEENLSFNMSHEIIQQLNRDFRL